MRKILLTGSLLLTFSGYFYQSFAMSTAYEGKFTSEVAKKHYIGDVVEEFTQSLIEDKEFAKLFFEEGGWTHIDTKVGRGGIDNLFVKFDKNGNVKKVLIVECKGNSSILSNTKHKGFQMSKEWILKSLEEKITALKGELYLETDPKKVENLKKQLKVLKQVKALVERNLYRARLLELQYLSGKKFKLILKEIPAGVSSEELRKIKGNLKVTAEKIISLNGKDKLSRILRKTIKKVTDKYKKAGKFIASSQIRKTMVKATIKIPNTSKILSKIKYLKATAVVKNALELIPVVGPLLGLGAQIAYDIYLANTLERLAKEQEILGKQIQINTEKIVELTIGQEKLALVQRQLIAQVANLSDSIAQVRNQIAEIKKGIFVTGLELLKNYFITGDIAYLNEAIAQLLTARNVKNPKLEPIITLYLLNAYAEKFRKVKNTKEIELIKKEFKHLADLTYKDSKNLKLLFTAYSALGDIPFEEKNQTFRKAVLKVINQKLGNNLFDDAVKLAENYGFLTGDRSLYKLAIERRLENYNRHKNFQNPAQAMEIIEKYQNSLLVKEAVKYLYRNNYFTLALNVLNSKDLHDEVFEIKAYLCIFYYLGDTQRIEKLIKLVEENPTYRKTTKEVVLKLKKLFKENLKRNPNEVFDVRDVVSF